MTDDFQGYRRRNSLRYSGYDYTSPGAYFVTFCAHAGRVMFGTIIDQVMVLNPLGQIAVQCWSEFATRHQSVRVDSQIVMPNHVHALLWILDKPEQSDSTPTAKQRRFGDAIARSLSTLIGTYKSAVTQKAKNQRLIPGLPLWQDNFWDRIVRGEQELQRIRDYIRSNPARWVEDQLHPDAPPNQFNRTWQRWA